MSVYIGRYANLDNHYTLHNEGHAQIPTLLPPTFSNCYDYEITYLKCTVVYTYFTLIKNIRIKPSIVFLAPSLLDHITTMSTAQLTWTQLSRAHNPRNMATYKLTYAFCVFPANRP